MYKLSKFEQYKLTGITTIPIVSKDGVTLTYIKYTYWNLEEHNWFLIQGRFSYNIVYLDNFELLKDFYKTKWNKR